MVRKARLLFTDTCNRNCRGCCNRNWKGEPAKEITFDELLEFDEIYITGGEPMLFVSDLKELITNLKKHDKKVFVYTANPYPYNEFLNIMLMTDGLTLTLHNWNDVKTFKALELDKINIPNRDLRLNVFPKVTIKNDNWDVRPKKWIVDAPLPDGEEFVRLKS